VWFLAPTVVLAEQQHRYLTEQLPAYQSRLICGSDNVEHWSSPAIWNAVLQDIRIVVSTSRILLDALVHGFVRMSRMALLVFDEAHHCSKRHDTNRIMQEFYHAFPSDQSERRPHILGLSASPITNAKPGALEALEHNMNAICKAPTRHIEELQRHVHQPQLCKLTHADVNVDPSLGRQRLGRLLSAYDITSDPYVRYLQKDESFWARRKLAKAIRSKSTDSHEQLKTLDRRTKELEDQIGR
jgi:superfamily II DNA or RNA helicase